jgi:hypothetical protein
MRYFTMSKPNSKIEKKFLVLFRRTALLSFVFFFTGCAVSLAPKYEQKIVDDLSASATEVYQLLSAASAGTLKSDFDKREENYDKVIGKLEALQLQINARPMPKNKTVDKIINKANSSLQKKGTTLISVNDTAPSAIALKNIIANLTKMKDVDKSQGVTAGEIKAFKGNIDIFFDQALTYERYLNS